MSRGQVFQRGLNENYPHKFFKFVGIENILGIENIYLKKPLARVYPANTPKPPLTLE